MRKLSSLLSVAALLLNGAPAAAATTINGFDNLQSNAGVFAQPTVTSAPVFENKDNPTDERLTKLEGKADDASTSISELKAITDQLQKIKFSGYVQGRFEWHQDSQDGVTSAGKPANTTDFLVRRGRLKAVYNGKNSEYLLQIDATPSGVVLKDAEATLIEPWTGLHMRVTAGQFKWPFGYEVLQSSSVREMPERTRMIRALFPGERDRGARLQLNVDKVRFAAAVVTGQGTSSDPIYGYSDKTAGKDVVGRLGVDLDHFVIGVSGYYGKNLITTLPVAATATAPAKPLSYNNVAKTRWGTDVQVYLNLLPIGATALKGEAMFGFNNGDPFYGWYALASQNVGKDFGVFARLDEYNPNTNKDGSSIATIGGGVQYFASSNLKASVVYEHPWVNIKNADVFTAQIQAMF